MNFLSDLYNFEGKNILIFGAGGHLCSEIATNFAKLNANLFLIDFSYEKLKKLEQKIKLFNKVSNIYLYDVNTTSYNDMSNLNQLINQEHQIDVLINGSGINSPKNYLDIEIEEWNKVIQSQLNSVFISCKLFGGSMVKNQKGSIINISSTSAGPPLSKAFAYSSAKAAITNLTKNLAREWALKGVRVNSLRPGFFPTEGNKKNFLDRDRIDKIMNHTPMKRFGDPKELFTAIMFLSSNASSFVTGSEVIVDGGFSCMTV